MDMRPHTTRPHLKRQKKNNYCIHKARNDDLQTLESPKKRMQKLQKELDSRGIEPRTSPMLRENHTTRPRARLMNYGRFKI
jgi:hypothetical protein